MFFFPAGEQVTEHDDKLRIYFLLMKFMHFRKLPLITGQEETHRYTYQMYVLQVHRDFE